MPSRLHLEVQKLRAWRAAGQHVDAYDRWWTDDGVIGAFRDFLASVRPQDWTPEDVTDLLQVLQESSTDYAAELAAQTPATVLAIAGHSLARGGIASDDIAEQLGCCVRSHPEHRPAAEALLQRFAQDAHERTRRIARRALAELAGDDR